MQAGESVQVHRRIGRNAAAGSGDGEWGAAHSKRLHRRGTTTFDVGRAAGGRSPPESFQPAARWARRKRRARAAWGCSHAKHGQTGIFEKRSSCRVEHTLPSLELGTASFRVAIFSASLLLSFAAVCFEMAALVSAVASVDNTALAIASGAPSFSNRAVSTLRPGTLSWASARAKFAMRASSAAAVDPLGVGAGVAGRFHFQVERFAELLQLVGKGRCRLHIRAGGPDGAGDHFERRLHLGPPCAERPERLRIEHGLHDFPQVAIFVVERFGHAIDEGGRRLVGDEAALRQLPREMKRAVEG